MRPLPDLPGVRHADHELPTGVRLHVAEAGDPGAPALLAAHGWPQHWWMWRGVIPALAETHRVICPEVFFADVLRAPARAEASSRLYRDFQLRELPALAAGRYAGARVELPVKLLFPRRDGAQHPAQLAGVERHVPRAEVEVVDGGHLLPDEQPALVAERARAWFA